MSKQRDETLISSRSSSTRDLWDPWAAMLVICHSGHMSGQWEFLGDAHVFSINIREIAMGYMVSIRLGSKRKKEDTPPAKKKDKKTKPPSGITFSSISKELSNPNRSHYPSPSLQTQLTEVKIIKTIILTSRHSHKYQQQETLPDLIYS